MKMEDLRAELAIRKERCRLALESPHTSAALKERVLMPEYHIYLLAEEGYKSFKSQEKPSLLSTVPAKIVAPQTD